MSANHPEAVVTMLALLRLGAVECPVNAGLRGQHLAHVLDHSGARVLIVDCSLADRVDEQLPSAPGVKAVVRRGEGQAPVGVSVVEYDELRRAGSQPPPFRQPRPDHPMNIIYTSGTTGPAKGAVLPHAFPIEQARIKIEQWGLTADDHEVPPGTVGELVVRPHVPGVMMTGYHRQPEATLAAFRNLWFHTGDLATIEADGYIRWVDRAADAIRRRGEMISSTKVERAVSAMAGVVECAAVGVPSELGEEDVKLVVVAAAGRSVDPAALIRHCQQTLPDFCQPRYLEVLQELPKGATHKVNKHHLHHTEGPTVQDLATGDLS